MRMLHKTVAVETMLGNFREVALVCGQNPTLQVRRAIIVIPTGIFLASVRCRQVAGKPETTRLDRLLCFGVHQEKLVSLIMTIIRCFV